MNWRKRTFDILFASVLIVVLGPILVVLLGYLLVREGRPLFYVSERMKAPNQPFNLWKLRSMTVVDQDGGVSGGDKTARITKTGAWLRRKRLDEVPQLWNILRGDLSFVGPRPPLRAYVDKFPDVYTAVLESRPGVTGVATIRFHKREEELLKGCVSAIETDDIYGRTCVPRKARLDLLYQRKQSLLYDLKLIWQTIGVLFGRDKKDSNLAKSRKVILGFHNINRLKSGPVEAAGGGGLS
jgi:lipopolysaccharide/colanic/teichoic acid biosynthesis glycosyltransferase